MVVVARRQVNNSFGVRVDYLLAQDSSRMLDPHLVGNDGCGKAHESANGACGRQEQQDSEWIKLPTAASPGRSSVGKSTSRIVRQARQ
jgi:hypothetical protein